jgi:protein-S-isoprenylcysteine O-methyltransferase Ste14
MESAAYYIALVMIMAIPAGMVPWIIIHPFVRYWRRMGPVPAYLVVGGVIAATMYGIYCAREPLLRIRFGVRIPFVVVSCVLFAVAMYIRVRVRRRLGVSTLVGLKEIFGVDDPQELVTEGVYSLVRHPRYSAIGLAVAAAALFSNYMAVYVLLGAYALAIHLIVLLEERELKKRFGIAYEEYSNRVPRFLPRFRRGRR